MNLKKLKVIYLMQDLPPYEYYVNAPRPSVNWDTPNGSWVGIWGYEWGDLLGKSILAYHPEYEFEVWQPDLRADKLYSHRFDNGLCHKLFPATIHRQLHKPVVTSEAILEQLRREQNHNEIILQTDLTPHSDWLILPNKHLKIMGILHGTIHLPIHEFFKIRKNPLRYYFLLREQQALKNIINYYDLITYQNDTNLDDLKSIYKGSLRKVTMGVDFEKFIPLDKISCRKELGLPLDKRIFITVGRMNSLKQNDKVIKAFNQLKDKFDFLLVMVGTAGSSEYMEYLQKIAAPLLAEKKILFTGYRSGDSLVKYYNSADLFLMTSLSEGCSVASMEAIACETPIFSTRTGYIAELQAAHQAGYVAGIRNYREWGKVLSQYLNGQLEITTLDRSLAMREFSWRAIAGKFDMAYQQLVESNQSFSTSNSKNS